MTLDSSLAIPGGVQSYVRGLADGLRGRDHQVTILTAGQVSDEDEQRGAISVGKRGELPLTGTASSLPLILVNPFEVRRRLRRGKFEIVHVPGHGGMLSWWAVLFSPAPVVASFLSFHESRVMQGISQLARPLFYLLNRKLAAKIAISQAAADYACIAFPGEFRVIPAGIDLGRFVPLGERSGREALVLFVGRLDPRKGIMDLLEAFDRLKVGSVGLRLLVVGDGPQRQVAEEYVGEHGLEKRVEFAGRVSDEELPEYYRRADLYCSPARGGESFGLVLLEAMASGLPVVAYGNEGYRQVLSGRLGEYLVEVGDIDGLRVKIEQLVLDGALRKEMGSLSLDKAKNYGWSRIAGEVEKVYQACVKDEKIGD